MANEQVTELKAREYEKRFIDNQVITTAIRRFKIKGTSPIGETEARGMVPKIGDMHDFDPNLRVTEVRVFPRNTPRTIWEAEVTYTEVYEKYLKENPLERAALVYWSYLYTEENFALDADGYAVINSVGDKFFPEPRIIKSYFRIYYKKNMKDIPDGLTMSGPYVNADVVKIDTIRFQPGSIRLDGMLSEEFKQENGVIYKPVTFVLTVAAYTNNGQWNPILIPDFGMHEYYGDDRRRIRINGEPVAVPVALEWGAKMFYPDPETIVFLEYKGYPEIPLGELLGAVDTSEEFEGIEEGEEGAE